MKKQAENVDGLSDSVVECRAFLHEEKQFITDRVTTGVGGEVIEYTRVMQCKRCRTIISTTIEVPSFRVKKRTYDRSQVDGDYSVKGGLHIFDARSAFLKRRFQ